MYIYVDKYTVKPGDTLERIAIKHELLTYKQILYVNTDIQNPDLIYPGQVINIPQIVPMITYKVKSGDTLGSIIDNYNKELMAAYGYQITYNEVLAYNPRLSNPDHIYPDMLIYLPEIL